jgi:hypothetical protein
MCGAVRYKVTGEPLVARVCWCRVCQKIAGNGTTNAIFYAAAIEVSGAMNSFVSTADSGNEITRYFCPNCGCHLFASSAASPELRVLRLGTLDDPSSIAPQFNIWLSSAPHWAFIDTSLESALRQSAPVQRQAPPPSAA